jgi:sugar phosphate isomerase/epimerase
MANIGVTLDTFGCWTEAGLKETITRAGPRLGLIQVADHVLGDKAVPARAVPNDGAIPLKRMFDWILSAGYGGAFEIEMLGPRIDKEGYEPATRRAADNVGKMLSALGA